MRFYLGTPEPCWVRRTNVPLFLSARRLRRIRKISWSPGAKIIDSSGFSELSDHGRWTVEAEVYAPEAERWCRELGNVKQAAIQDWMCEPWIIEKTGKSIAEHQRLTIKSLLDLRRLSPSVPWMPVLQGWQVDDYLRHVDMYADAGVDLRACELVGVGSVCRRQATREASVIFRRIAGLGIRTHAFGVKSQGLQMFGDIVTSADSMAWSFVARRRPIRMPGCTHVTCANCMRWALAWREALLEKVDGPAQQSMPF